MAAEGCFFLCSHSVFLHLLLFSLFLKKKKRVYYDEFLPFFFFVLSCIQGRLSVKRT